MKPLFNMQCGIRGTLHLVEKPNGVWALEVATLPERDGSFKANCIFLDRGSMQDLYDTLGMALAPELTK